MRHSLIVLAAILVAASPKSAFADRDPSPEERAAIERALEVLGYVSWRDIEFDDGQLEVDDARTADPDSRDVDLKLDAETLAVIEAE